MADESAHDIIGHPTDAAAASDELPDTISRIVELQSSLNEQLGLNRSLQLAISDAQSEIDSLRTTLENANSTIASRDRTIAVLKEQRGSAAADCKSCVVLAAKNAALLTQLQTLRDASQRAITPTVKHDPVSTPIIQQYAPTEFRRLPVFHLVAATGLPHMKPSDVPKLVKVSAFPTFKTDLFSWLTAYLPVLAEALVTAELIPDVADIDNP